MGVIFAPLQFDVEKMISYISFQDTHGSLWLFYVRENEGMCVISSSMKGCAFIVVKVEHAR
jgi:hypothetical protein